MRHSPPQRQGHRRNASSRSDLDLVLTDLMMRENARLTKVDHG
jgi:hypothetical protein